ncbi:hypothetical protein TRFO_12122 [Tritrichomonas foetus]|uniref:Uncharacterized protein n=1 Tax=Tritrichomonas foetus TaxID=1144522 RepID=A0A1J4J2I5_9EUKA|nr:hypothetical protein TRFO_12122 [Tritrichomonas foetus]|eukprot:OHS92945.1 hypothetical protein TRFO_12122 [Tritrichomonas foetus]
MNNVVNQSYLGTYTDITYDVTSNKLEVTPYKSEIPQSVLGLTDLIKNHLAKIERMKRHQELQEKYEKKMKKKQERLSERRKSSLLSNTLPVKIDIDDLDESSSSSSSSEFEVERDRKYKAPKVKVNNYVFGFTRPQPEVRRMFVTHKAPLTRNKEKDSLRRQYVHLASRFSSRRNLVTRAPSEKQREFMRTSIDDL